MAEQTEPATEPDGTPNLTARTDERDGAMVVTVRGELDMATAPIVAVAVKDALARGLPVVLDLSGLRFFSSAGLTLLAQLDTERRQRSVDVRLVGDQRVVILPLELTGLRDLFPIHTSLADALAAIA
jgi:anti-sigma B factor antagonist